MEKISRSGNDVFIHKIGRNLFQEIILAKEPKKIGGSSKYMQSRIVIYNSEGHIKTMPMYYKERLSPSQIKEQTEISMKNAERGMFNEYHGKTNSLKGF